ncbi:hypothetical protein N7495_002258 [Penicillium taxi]|uniref:uncharacterized protein n=1 Tax=Penicillium taxi TaxID=168475 RepID=UPI0025458760|nr:uncharacterized protein N7495_002258 [Penicillium taxi]KAJ5901730.1 hypothetical protein N7495_002258 [Penicillium taxi]
MDQQQDAYLLPANPDNGQATATHPTQHTTTGHVPACLLSASVTYFEGQIYAFGGFDQFTDEVYNHVLRLDLTSMQWELVDNFGDIPGVRMGHTATLYGDKLIVFGGENEHRDHLADVVILDLRTFHWTLPEIRGSVSPRGRARHSAVVHDNKLFIVGGLTGESNILDDLSYLDLQTWTWSRSWRFTSRFDHTMWVWDNRIWIFGGIGPNLERSADIWWLDLKDYPPFAGNTPSLSRVSSPSQPISPRSGTYTANSANISVRNIRKPLAPGPISCLKFQSGPNVPLLPAGLHFQAYASGALLDFTTPSDIVRVKDCKLSALDLNSLRWQGVATGTEFLSYGYRWHYCAVNETGTKSWLLGCNLSVVAANTDENTMGEVLSIDLEKFGFLGNGKCGETPDSAGDAVCSLGMDLAYAFDDPESGTDFIITALRDDYHPHSRSDTPTESPPQSQPTFVETNPSTSDPINVHMIFLLLRWPHFKRVYHAHMAEYHTKCMHIPEPYSVVRAFLYYLYTDSIGGLPENPSSVDDVAGMLVMSNLYDMPKLRLLCVHRLTRELDVENAAIVWERSRRSNEHMLMCRAASFCLTHWGRVVRTEGFKSLTRSELLDLCELPDTEGRIIEGPELEMVRESQAEKAAQQQLTTELLEGDGDSDGMDVDLGSSYLDTGSL